MSPDFSKLAFYSNTSTDKIIGVTSGSIPVGAGDMFGTAGVATATFDTGFGDTCFFEGLVSVDGTTWNPLGTFLPASGPTFQTTTASAYMVGGVLTVKAINYITSAKTVSYKIIFFAKDNQGAITPLSITDKLFFDSSKNYQKIFKSGSFAVSTTTPTTVTHSLGYVPKVRIFFSPTSAASGANGSVTLPAGCLTGIDWFTNPDMQISSSTVSFGVVSDTNSYPSGISGTLYYRIYHDS